MPLEEMHFSAGQKQLLYIARAIIHHLQFKTQIILMDEVTSSMDHQTRVRVNKTMELAFGKCTWVIISHQLRDTTECDLIVTLSNGWLVEVDLLDTIGADLARLFSELAGLEPAAIEGNHGRCNRTAPGLTATPGRGPARQKHRPLLPLKVRGLWMLQQAQTTLKLTQDVLMIARGASSASGEVGEVDAAGQQEEALESRQVPNLAFVHHRRLSEGESLLMSYLHVRTHEG